MSCIICFYYALRLLSDKEFCHFSFVMCHRSSIFPKFPFNSMKWKHFYNTSDFLCSFPLAIFINFLKMKHYPINEIPSRKKVTWFRIPCNIRSSYTVYFEWKFCTSIFNLSKCVFLILVTKRIFRNFFPLC